MKQIFTIIILSIFSVSIGYVLRSQTNEYEVRTASLEPPVKNIKMPDIEPTPDIQNTAKTPPPPAPEPQKPKMTLSEKILEQGDALLVSMEHEKAVTLQIKNKTIPLVSIDPRKSIAIYGIDVREEPGAISVTLLQDNEVLQEEKINITKRNFPVTQLVLSDTQVQAGVTPEKAATQIVQNDNAKLYEILDDPLPEIHFKTSFAHPLPSQIIVGGFGNIRKSGETEIRHLGVDLDGKRGDPVKTIQDGVVRLTRNLSNYGNTIVIDHGASIFSMYLHLNSASVKEGDKVEKGKTIGTIGNTGDYSLDPHLHLSIKANGASVDPIRFIETTRKIPR